MSEGFDRLLMSAFSVPGNPGDVQVVILNAGRQKGKFITCEPVV